MTRQDVIELATQLTERKGEKVLNNALLLSHVLTDFCARNRFWWRQYTGTWNTVNGTQQYDLSSIVTSPALTELTIEEIVTLSIVTITSPFTTQVLQPIFDNEVQAEILQNTVATQPSRYFLGNNDYKTIVMDPANGVYKVLMTAWLMPDLSTDSTSQSIPLVPPQFHRVIVSGMEARIWRSIYGPTNPKFVTAKQDYEDGIILAQSRPRFTTNYSQQLTQSESSVQSTS